MVLKRGSVVRTLELELGLEILLKLEILLVLILLHRARQRDTYVLIVSLVLD